MPRFESFIPEAEKRENEEGYSAESFDKRMGVVERFTKKFPKFKALALAFITTTASMSAPEFVYASEPTQGTKTEQGVSHDKKETAESALEKVGDQRFKDIVEKVKADMDSANLVIPADSLYGMNVEHNTINGGVTSNEERIGDLPESAQNVFITAKTSIGQSVMEGGARGDKSTANTMDFGEMLFYIQPAGEGSVVGGGKIEMQSFGTTRAGALQGALEEAVFSIESDVYSEVNMNTSEEVTFGGERTSDGMFANVARVSGSQFIKEYKIVKVEQVEGGVFGEGGQGYSVTVEVTSGVFTPEK